MKLIRAATMLLGSSTGYNIFSRLIGGTAAWDVFLNQYAKPLPSERVLDIGCGPAEALDHLPEVEYTGIDISRDYIGSATKRFGARGRFLCADVGLLSLDREQGTFDLAIASGVLHHLDDERALRLLELAHRSLRPGGRLVTHDGCYAPSQSRMARWALAHDRGRFVRNQSEYVRLASSLFAKVDAHLRHDLLRVPYTHLIMRCSN